MIIYLGNSEYDLEYMYCNFYPLKYFMVDGILEFLYPKTAKNTFQMTLFPFPESTVIPLSKNDPTNSITCTQVRTMLPSGL